MSAIVINHKMFKNAGFNEEQTEALLTMATHQTDMLNQQQQEIVKHELKIFEKDVSNKIETSENRIEKAIKDLEIRLVREIQDARNEVHDIKSDVRLIKSIGGFMLSAATLISIVTGILHLHISLY